MRPLEVGFIAVQQPRTDMSRSLARNSQFLKRWPKHQINILRMQGVLRDVDILAWLGVRRPLEGSISVADPIARSQSATKPEVDHAGALILFMALIE